LFFFLFFFLSTVILAPTVVQNFSMDSTSHIEKPD
jgi:hypothetical protein